MAGTSIRAFTRLLEASNASLWVIAPDGSLAYLSSGLQQWLGLDPAELLGRRSIAGWPVSEDYRDRLAAALSPPPGLSERGTASLRISPPVQRDGSKSEFSPLLGAARETRFVRIGVGASGFTIAVAGDFDDRSIQPELQDVVAIRRRLDLWRQQASATAAILTVGQSRKAKRLRQRLSVAARSRVDCLIVGPQGCRSETVAASMHQESTTSELTKTVEPSVLIDGSLMDPELLDVTLSPLATVMENDRRSKATAIISGLDQMPVEAQEHLANRHSQYSGRLRLIGLASRIDERNSDERNSDERNSDEQNSDAAQVTAGGLPPAWDDAPPVDGIASLLMDIFCGMTVSIPPLTQRLDDLPMIATALLDRRRSGVGLTRGGRGNREQTAARLSRTALDAMVIYPWPGDFDELDGAIRHALSVARGDAIGVENLPLAVRSFRPSDPLARARVRPIDLDEAVKRFESKLIQQAVEDADGNRAEAARRLNISRARLLRKLEEDAR